MTRIYKVVTNCILIVTFKSLNWSLLSCTILNLWKLLRIFNQRESFAEKGKCRYNPKCGFKREIKS